MISIAIIKKIFFKQKFAYMLQDILFYKDTATQMSMREKINNKIK